MGSLHPVLDTPVARAIEEALATVATEPVRDAVMTRALREARRTSVPERGGEVVEFAEGPLRRALASRLGEDVADAVLDQLRPVLQRAAGPRTLTPVRASAPPAAPAPAAATSDDLESEESGIYVTPRPLTQPAPVEPLPLVLLATQDVSASAALAQALGGRATVRIVEGLLELLDAIQEDPHARHVLVLDGGYPSIQLHSLITVAPDLATTTRVVVWRVVDSDRPVLAGTGSHVTAQWIRCHARDIEHLAEACRRALR